MNGRCLCMSFRATAIPSVGLAVHRPDRRWPGCAARPRSGRAGKVQVRVLASSRRDSLGCTRPVLPKCHGIRPRAKAECRVYKNGRAVGRGRTLNEPARVELHRIGDEIGFRRLEVGGGLMRVAASDRRLGWRCCSPRESPTAQATRSVPSHSRSDQAGHLPARPSASPHPLPALLERGTCRRKAWRTDWLGVGWGRRRRIVAIEGQRRNVPEPAGVG